MRPPTDSLSLANVAAAVACLPPAERRSQSFLKRRSPACGVIVPGLHPNLASCTLSLAGAATSIIFVATKVLSRQARVLSRQKYACRDRTFVATKNDTCCSCRQWEYLRIGIAALGVSRSLEPGWSVGRAVESQ